MKQLIIILIGLFFSFGLKSQEIDLSEKWKDLVTSTEGFEQFDKTMIDNFDLSQILSNQLRFKNDPISTYIGIFGPKYRRIDFHLTATKNGSDYVIVGKSKLGDNIRELNGTMQLENVLFSNKNSIADSVFIGILNTVLREPGDREGDGVFTGIFVIAFYLEDGKVSFFKTSSGEPPDFTNTFVGKWTRNNSEIERKCIFSFEPAGLYDRLPFCDEIYTIYEGNDDYVKIKEEYVEFGWEDYDYKGRKTEWWK